MTKHASQIIFAFLVLLLIGCEEKEITVNTLQGNPPFIQSVTLAPDSTNIDAQVPLDGMYTVSTVVTARITDPEGATNIARVAASVIRPNSSTTILSVNLRDDGTAPDLTGNDGIYSANIEYKITRPQAGRHRIQVSASDIDGLRSNVFEQSMFVLRNNSAPLLSNLVAPDSVTLPATGSILFPLHVQAADSDGLADITDVFFKSLDSSTPNNRIYLYDDGSQNIIFQPNIRSGDLVAGDGIFSITIQLNSSNQRGTYRFAFQAFDSFGDSSGVPLLHQLVVQ